MSDAEAIQALRAALGQLVEQAQQMAGLFPDEDGAIERAMSDADAALASTEPRGTEK
jgi:ABC-type transporter Mla subunit MlaD